MPEQTAGPEPPIRSELLGELTGGGPVNLVVCHKTMRCPRLRFSVRTLLVAVFVVAALLGVSIRFGPHVMWRIVHSDISAGIVPIPSKPMFAAPPRDKLLLLNVGPVSFQLPETMAKRVTVHRGIGGVFLQCYDDDRSLSLQLPQRDDGLLQQGIDDFPEKSKLTFPRLYKEVADAQSSDFSFGMSLRDLRWHKWLLTTRSKVGIDIALIEYLWRPDLEGNLVSLYSAHTFQWGTTDRQWEGMVYFKSSSRDDMDWIRHVCATFVVQGDPSVLDNRDDASIESMITFTQLDEHGRTKP